MPPQRQQRSKGQQLSDLEVFINDNMSDLDNEMLYNALELRTSKHNSTHHKSISVFGDHVHIVHGLITLIPETILADPTLCFMDMSMRVPFRVGFSSDMSTKSYKVYPLYIRFVASGKLLENTIHFFNAEDRKRYRDSIADLLKSNYSGGDEGEESDMQESVEHKPRANMSAQQIPTAELDEIVVA